jgi:hypothetical protein
MIPGWINLPGERYDTYEDAAAAIADYVAGCIGYVASTQPQPLAFSASFDGTEVVTQVQNDLVEVSPTQFTGDTQHWVCITIPDATTITLDYSGSNTGTSPSGYFGILGVWLCDGSDATTDDEAASSGTISIGPLDAGTYYLEVNFQSQATSAGTTTADFTVTCDNAFVVNPVAALWDDSGTNRQLDACPKMLLPPLSESTATWYADATEAATAIADLTSNCVGFIESIGGTQSFTATDGGTSLVFTFTDSGGLPPSSPPIWGSVNAVDGATLSVAYTGYVGGDVDIYDYTGTLVETHTGTTTPFTSAALPYTGRYIVRIVLSNDTGGSPATATIASSGALSVNPIQALYDVSLSCPARDNC